MKTLSKIEKLKLTGLCIEAVTGVIGGSLILSQAYPYVTLSVLAIGAVATKIVSFIKEKENKNLQENNSSQQENQP